MNERERKMGLFSKNEIVTKKQSYELTEQVKVADVKQYLMDEYDRAFDRESTIKDLELEIKQLTETKIKYDALLVISDKNRERLLKCEEEIKQLKVNKKELEVDNRVLKNTNTNIELNYKKHLDTLTKQNDDLTKKNNKLEKEIEKLKKANKKYWNNKRKK